MKKTEIIEAIARATGMTKTDVENVYSATFDLIKEELTKGNEFSVAGFGKFKVTERAARTGRNPQTGETINIAASKSVGFKVGKDLKDKLN